ncbi:hypothetical protein B0J13DRAFT_616070 [Dactylonectria estremocensis]|uniref:Uncharacterized protein n=1 Tax=Dactylonectria estremocensis TaxID=1079267 RepID=A0A9P9FJJ6_9HYPO|nr:hypothetical protein B0J13DRAFT_616070 [Dactylonectria estremocensis]
MDKASLLTASRVELGVSVSPRSDVIRLLGPALEIAVRFQKALSSVTLFLCIKAWFLASLTFVNILYATRIAAVKAFVATKFGAFHGYTMSTTAANGVWNCQTVQKLRKKLFYEFAVFILGGGNWVFVLVFWPGWWVIAGAFWGIWMLTS